MNYKNELQWIPDGFHFLPPNEAQTRRELIQNISDFFKQKGFGEIMLPGFDYTSAFQAFYDGEESKKIFKIRDLGGDEISPGSDLTIQAVKGMSGFTDGEFHKIFYIGNVLKDHHKNSGGRREICQAGAEIFGNSEPQTVLEMILVMEELLKSLKLENKITLVLGDVRVFRLIANSLEKSGFNIQEIQELFFTKDFPKLQELLKKGNIDKKWSEVLNTILFEYQPDALIREAKTMEAGIPGIKKAVDEIEALLNGWKRSSHTFEVCIDFSMIRDLNYYTGTVFYAFAQGQSEPLLSGGVYDGLFKRFTGKDREACGFALDLDILEELRGRRN